MTTRFDRCGAGSEVELEAYVTSDREPKVAIVVRAESRGAFGDRVETLVLDEKAARQLLSELHAALEGLR